MKREKKEKPVLSSEALKFQKFKIMQWVLLVLTAISAVFATVMTMYYAFKPGDFGVELPRTLGFVGVGLTVFFAIAYIIFYYMTKNMLKK